VDAHGLKQPAASAEAGAAAPETEEQALALAPLGEDSPLRTSCDYIVSNPGKRFRASLVESAAHYGPRPGDRLVRQSAVAVELFHAATLAHDDVVDDGQVRRGKATVGAHAGNLAAGLSGGWLFARAIELVAEIDAEATSRFAEATSVVCCGEMLESRDLFDVDRSRDRYLEAIEAKTARLIAFSAWLGAKVGGASPEVAECLNRYGEAVGMAFQIADDILDLVGHEARTGKTPGSDLRHGVYTLPTIVAMEAEPELKQALISEPSEAELPDLVARIRRTGAVDVALAETRDWIELAVAVLPSGTPAGEHGQQLASLAREVGARAEEMA
jgi:heptaprenyl diphosphate synthase